MNHSLALVKIFIKNIPNHTRIWIIYISSNKISIYFRKPLGINEILNVGDFCACPSESEDWYRGLIRQFDANGHAIVFKIDYGDVQCIPIEYLRPLQVKYFQD